MPKGTDAKKGYPLFLHLRGCMWTICTWVVSPPKKIEFFSFTYNNRSENFLSPWNSFRIFYHFEMRRFVFIGCLKNTQLRHRFSMIGACYSPEIRCVPYTWRLYISCLRFFGLFSSEILCFVYPTNHTVFFIGE